MCRVTMILAILTLAVAIFVAACGSGDDEESNASNGNLEGGSVSVEMDDFYFTPAEISARPGQTLTIKVKNEGAAEHTFTVDALNIDQVVPAGEAMDITVSSDQAGSFEFYCRFHHSKMSGTLTIGSGAAAPSTTAPTGGGGSGGYGAY